MSSGRLLIIDDDPAVLSALPETLRLWMPGSVVDLCGTARLALDRIEAIDYDAIISDIRMPDTDGLTLLERIKTCRPNTPVLLITGYGDQTLATQALRGGAFDYILKPIDRDYFLSSLGRALHLRHLSRQAEERLRAEAALRESQQSLYTLVETVPCLLVITDREGRMVLFNRRAEELTGYTREETLGKLIFDLLIPKTWIENVKQRFSHPASGIAHHSPWMTKGGEERLIEWRCTPITWLNHTDPCMLEVGIDVTERRQAEETIAHLHRELDDQVRAYEKLVQDLEASKTQLQGKIVDLEMFQDVVVGRELKMIALEKQVATLARQLDALKPGRPHA
jgi:PAS domain S-box-containing protein